MKHVTVVGGGPAGLMAAEVLSGAGIVVDVYDAMPSVGRKFLLAGKGGLNLTHSELAREPGLHAHRHLGRAGAEGDHGEADHQRRDPEPGREARGTAHQQHGTGRQQHQPENE